MNNIIRLSMFSHAKITPLASESTIYRIENWNVKSYIRMFEIIFTSHILCNVNLLFILIFFSSPNMSCHDTLNCKKKMFVFQFSPCRTDLLNLLDITNVLCSFILDLEFIARLSSLLNVRCRSCSAGFSFQLSELFYFFDLWQSFMFASAGKNLNILVFRGGFWLMHLFTREIWNIVEKRETLKSSSLFSVKFWRLRGWCCTFSTESMNY